MCINLYPSPSTVYLSISPLLKSHDIKNVLSYMIHNLYPDFWDIREKNKDSSSYQLQCFIHTLKQNDPPPRTSTLTSSFSGLSYPIVGGIKTDVLIRVRLCHIETCLPYIYIYKCMYAYLCIIFILHK